MNRSLSKCLLPLSFLLAAVPIASVKAKAEQETAPQLPADVVAMVGDQAITFEQLNIMINSSAVVGLSLPGLGTPERDLVRVTLLDKVISANLLYLDAVKKGLDKDPAYQQAVKDFSDGMLSGLYLDRYVLGDIEISDAEVDEYFSKHIKQGTELTDDVKLAIRSSLRKQAMKKRKATLGEHVRKDVEVTINEKNLDPEDDEVRVESELVASIDGKGISWGEVKKLLGTPLNAGSMENRLKALNGVIDTRIMTDKGRAAGLERDPGYRVPLNQFSKVRLINNHRARLVEELEPGDQEIREYYANNRNRIMSGERRRVQTVVLNTREEAEDVKRKIETAEMTMYQAAARYSTVPDAGKTLGRLGWVNEGSGYPELDKVTFSMQVNVIGGPVQSPAGWQLVRTLEKLDAVNADIEDEQTQLATRRVVIKERINEYIVNLRKDAYPVEIYNDRINQFAQKEVDWYKAKAETQKSPQEVMEQIEKLRGTK